MIDYYVALFLLYTDITLTFYTFFLWKKVGNPDYNNELNIFTRLIMKKIGITPFSYLICSAWSFTLFITITRITLDLIRFLSMFIGALVVVNIIHLTNISRINERLKKKLKGGKNSRKT